MASKSAPEALEGWVLRGVSRRFRICRRSGPRGAPAGIIWLALAVVLLVLRCAAAAPCATWGGCATTAAPTVSDVAVQERVHGAEEGVQPELQSCLCGVLAGVQAGLGGLGPRAQGLLRARSRASCRAAAASAAAS
eukprot:1325429-Alexandrium_andersonii.AAC.1